MNNEDFNKILDDITASMKKVLAGKAEEYATDVDRLHNFKVAAELQGVTMRQALGGMMAKHTVSVYDLINAEALASPEMWAEKLGDHLNYLVLLAAIVEEERSGLSTDKGVWDKNEAIVWNDIREACRWVKQHLRDELEIHEMVGSDRRTLEYRWRFAKDPSSNWAIYPTLESIKNDILRLVELGVIK